MHTRDQESDDLRKRQSGHAQRYKAAGRNVRNLLGYSREKRRYYQLTAPVPIA